MTTYTDAEARQKLDSVLDAARKQGEVRIRRADGVEFLLRPVAQPVSPLDVGCIDVNPSTEEVVEAVRQSRAR